MLNYFFECIDYLIYKYIITILLKVGVTMEQYEALINTLKIELKVRGVTYAEIAKMLSLSEANIKRLFSTRRFTLERLEQVCRVINIDLVELIRLYDESRNRITYLSRDQEKELVSDVKLLLVAVCVQHHYSLNKIISKYEINQNECIQYLAKLDRLKLIDLLPNNQFRLLINEEFHWLPNGPIEKLFKQQMQPEFLNTDFSKKDQFRIFLNAHLSQSSHDEMLRKIEKLSIEFNELNQRDMAMSHDETRNESLLIAFRPWEFSAFKNLRRA